MCLIFFFFWYLVRKYFRAKSRGSEQEVGQKATASHIYAWCRHVGRRNEMLKTGNGWKT